MNLAYHISENLASHLEKINKLRIELLTLPLSPKNELRLKWEAGLERIAWSLAMTETNLSKNEIAKILVSPPKKPTSVESDILNFKKTLSYIRENWIGNQNQIDMAVVKKIYDLSCRETMGRATGLTEYAEKRMNFFLDYLEKAKSEHPAIAAAIAQEQTINVTPFDKGNGRIGRLLSYLYLYKSGYDMREMLVLEEFYRRDIVTYRRMLELAKIEGNLTFWLEYFAFGLLTALKKALDNVRGLNFSRSLPASLWKLNNRQRQILEKLEVPGAKITNKEVVKLFGVSQITASRDLAKLTSLGLLLNHGKGRGAAYTKA